MNIKEARVTTFVFGGTLGDAFIVLCKLYSRYKKTGETFNLLRYSLHPDMDRSIRALFDTVPFIEYPESCNAFESLNDMHEAFEKTSHPLIETTWKKSEAETFEIDYADLDPFPVIQTPEVDVKRDLTGVGIQLHCGSEGANFRGFSLKWLVTLRRSLPRQRFNVYLFGTGAGCYSEGELNAVCEEHGIINMIGKTDFVSFMSFIKEMKCFISFEGFSAFFAMSQKVPTIMYDQYFFGVDDSIHSRWKERSLIIRLNSNYIGHKIRYWSTKYLKGSNLYTPGSMEAVINFINSNLNGKA